MCTNRLDCQILTVFTPFNTSYHKEATVNTPSFDEADLSFLSLSKQLNSSQSGPKGRLKPLILHLGSDKCFLEWSSFPQGLFAPIRRLPIMMLPW